MKREASWPKRNIHGAKPGDGVKPWRATSQHDPSARAGSPLALDLSESAVALWCRLEDGTYEEVARAPLASDDFSARIDALRIEALVRDPARSPITIWLPGSQILERSYLLASRRRTAALAEAARCLQAETEYASDELAVDLVPSKPGTPTVVLAALIQTVREAREYAVRWGFVPGLISTRSHSAGFDGRAPSFELAKSRATVARNRFLQAAGAAILALTAGYAGVKTYDASRPLLRALTIAEVPGQAALPLVHRDMIPALERTSVAVVRSVGVQSLPLRSARIWDLEADLAVGAREYAPAVPGGSPAVLLNPAASVPLQLGAAGSVPVRVRPSRLIAPVRPRPGVRTAQLLHALDRIRLNTRNLARRPDEKTGPRFTDVAEAIIAVAAPTEAEAAQPSFQIAAVSANAASLVPTTGDTSLVADFPEATEVEAEPATDPDNQLYAAIDPVKLIVPVPRPERVSGEETILSPAQPDSTDEEAAQSTEPEETPETIVSPEQVQETAQPDPELKLAALTSPRPKKRPSRLSAEDLKLPKRSVSKKILAKPVPTSVRRAAGESGLALEETNLIGVIDANSGRRALVRLPDGDFRKVSRGDVLNGWRVSSISREAMRLTRQGQNRTLLLVSR